MLKRRAVIGLVVLSTGALLSPAIMKKASPPSLGREVEAPAGARVGRSQTGESLDEETRERMRKLAVESPDAQTRWSATKLLVKAEDPDFLFLLQDRILRDPEPSVRQEAVVLLGTFDDPAAVPILQEALKDIDPWVRNAAKTALGGK